MSRFKDYKELSEKEFSLYTYQKEDGSIDYDAYVQIQSDLNKRKLHLNGPSEIQIEQMSHYIRAEFQAIGLVPKVGLCHGTRQGHEQLHFSKHLDIAVMGTEISDTAEQFPQTIKWDFHDVQDAWVDNIDFIYSNSLDHSYDPIYCLKQWFKCLRVGGICILGWEKSDGHIEKEKAGLLSSKDSEIQGDPFCGTLEAYAKIIKIAGETDGVTGLKYILNTEYAAVTQPKGIFWDIEKSEYGLFDYHFVIQKFANTPKSAIPIQSYRGLDTSPTQ